MSWPLILSIATLVAAPFAAGMAVGASPQHKGYAVAGPVAHENLAIYFVHGASAAGPVPLTLQEAMLKGTVAVHETGQVSELVIENTGSEDVFVQAGDIVKGGKQDRVLTVSLLVPARSGKLPIGAYCVESGRWAARGKEDVGRFSSAEKSVPSRAAKLAMLAPSKPAAEAPPSGQHQLRDQARESDRPSRITGNAEQRQLDTGRSAGASRQSEVWAEVSKIQAALSASVNQSVNARESASSLQLSLENKNLDAARSAYVAALSDAANDTRIVGAVVVINGRISSADIYPSHGLFRKMWPKLLDAAGTEAISERRKPSEAPPGAEAVREFLAKAEAAEIAPATSPLPAPVARQVRDAQASLVVETRRKDGELVHRTYVAK